MSWQATAWASRQRTGHATLKLLLIVLADYTDDDGYSYPKIATLSDKCEVSYDTVQRGLKALVEQGLIQKAARHVESGRQTSNGYWLMMPGVRGGPVPQACEDQRKAPTPADCGGSTRAAPMQGMGGTDAVHPPAPMPPLEPTSITSNDSSSSSATPQKKSGSAKKAKAPRPSRWTDKPLAERMGQNGVPYGADGSEDWAAMVFEVQFHDLIAMARRNSAKPVSDGSMRARLGKLIKEHGAFEASKRIAQCLKTGPGGDPMTYIEGVKRAERDEEQRARDSMRAPIDYR